MRIERKVRFAPEPAEKKEAPPPSGRVPRISRLMALAIRMDTLLREGAVKDYAALARIGHVSRARLTQIMNLLHLAPDIQEELLFLPPIHGRREHVTEKVLRPVAAETSWRRQREVWRDIAGFGG